MKNDILGLSERYKINVAELRKLTFQIYSFNLKPDDIRLINRCGITNLKKDYEYGHQYFQQGSTIYVLEFHNGYRADTLTDEILDAGYEFQAFIKKYDIDELSDLGRFEFLENNNTKRLMANIEHKKNIESQQSSEFEDSQLYNSLTRQLKVTEKIIERFYDWFYENGLELPNITERTPVERPRASTKKQWNQSKIDLVEECIRRYVKAQHASPMDAFRWGAKNYTIKGEDIEAEGLYSYYRLGKTRNHFDERDGNFYRICRGIEKLIE